MGIGDINVESQGLGTGKRSRSRLDSTYPKRSSDTKSVACWKKLISSHSFFLFPKLTGASSDSTRAKVPCAARIYGRRDGGCLGWIQGASPSTVESSEVVRVLVCVLGGWGQVYPVKSIRNLNGHSIGPYQAFMRCAFV